MSQYEEVTLDFCKCLELFSEHKLSSPSEL